MPSIALRAALALAILALLAGCITAYEPITGAPAGLPARATLIAPPPQSTTLPAAAPEVVPLATHPTLPPAAIPATAAGRQLRWLTGVLSSGDARTVEQHFAPDFLAQVPPVQFDRIVHEWRRDELGLGAVEVAQIEEGPTPDTLIAFIRGTSGRYAQVRLSVDSRGQIAGLLLAPAIGFRPGQVETWGRFDDLLAALPGMVSFGTFEVISPENAPLDFTPIHTVNPSEHLSIGSTFKLYILGALAEAVAQGRISWDQPVAIVDDLKSLPPGLMQLELEGAEFPVSRYAELMITIGDNTAADHLLSLLGRETVEAYMAKLHARPQLNRPFLSTMDFFRIKLGPDRAALAPRYGQSDEASRLAMLAPGGEVAQTTPSLAAAALWRGPFEIQRIGWFASAEDLARLMTDLLRLERIENMEPLGRILRTNPGLAFDPRVWRTAAYKGGSEPGVLNMTWLLERTDGRRFIMTIAWSNPERAVETRRLTDLAAAAAGLLAAE
jgi:beta-lactamase class A